MKKLLCYDDVSLIPNWSNLNGRDDCDVSIDFLGDKCKMPIILAPMTFITSPEMIYTFWKNNLVTTYHRYWKDAETQYDSLLLGLFYVLSEEEEQREVCLSKFDDLKTIVPELYKEQAKEIINSVYFAVGGIKKYKDWIDYLYIKKGIKRFCIDVANGMTDECSRTIKYIKSLDDTIKVIAGNYSEKRYLSDCPDAIRVGIGGGSCCETAQATGFYYPSFQAIIDWNKPPLKCSIIADGGIKNAGDIAKAMAVGANVVMCGKLFAGTSASNGRSFNKNKELIVDNEEPIFYKEFQGMASIQAKEIAKFKRGSIEGKCGLVPYVGKTQDLINDIYENLKSSLAYCGAKNWKEFVHKVEIGENSTFGNVEKNSRLI